MSTQLRERALQAMPGGVNSPVRAFRSVESEPIFARRAKGALLETTDGRILIDYCMAFGPMILGHAHPEVTAAIKLAAEDGTSYAVTTQAEIELAELIKAAIPSIERVRLVSSGTEACMTAIRLARGYTGRSKILKFTGCYHGHTDSMLVKAGSGVAGLTSASSAGVPPGCTADTLIARYNSTDDVAQIIQEHSHDLAAIIVEPIAANAGLMLPDDGFLPFLRAVTKASGALLIFDEVISGFRLTFGGYQNICGIAPDLTCLGKIVGGGMPVGALGGRADVMERLAPSGDVYQAGTLSGNPVSVAAGLATLRILKRTPPYTHLKTATMNLVNQIETAARSQGVQVKVPTIGSIFSVFFTDRRIREFDDVMTTAREKYIAVFRHLLSHGVYLPPSPYEVCFLSAAHNESMIERTAAAWLDALKSLAV